MPVAVIIYVTDKTVRKVECDTHVQLYREHELVTQKGYEFRVEYYVGANLYPADDLVLKELLTIGRRLSGK